MWKMGLLQCAFVDCHKMHVHIGRACMDRSWTTLTGGPGCDTCTTYPAVASQTTPI